MVEEQILQLNSNSHTKAVKFVVHLLNLQLSCES